MPRRAGPLASRAVAVAAALAAAVAHAAEFRVPAEVLVSVEGWTKVRDAGGAIGWIAAKGLADRRVLVVRVPVADVRANPDDAAPVVFRAEQNVLLELAEAASSPATTASPGWVKVRHRDGQVGFVRLPQIFGL